MHPPHPRRTRFLALVSAACCALLDAGLPQVRDRLEEFRHTFDDRDEAEE